MDTGGIDFTSTVSKGSDHFFDKLQGGSACPVLAGSFLNLADYWRM